MARSERVNRASMVFLLFYIAVVISIGTPSLGCPTGRLYFGSLNSTFPTQVKRTGIYQRQPEDSSNHPLYKHETSGEYLYFVSGSLVGGHWAISATVGGLDAYISVSTYQPSPERVRQPWYVWDEGRELWIPVPGLRATCVQDDFVTCQSGKVAVGGLERRGRDHIQEPRMGDYILTNQILDLRPVYRQAGTRGNFLFHKDGYWLIGSRPGVFTVGLMVRDSAWRPELITAHWVVFTGSSLERREEVNVRCKGAPLSDDLAQEEIAHDLGGGPGVPEDACSPTACLFEGQCSVSIVTESVICACKPGYFGFMCQSEITCGAPPATGNSHVVASTGRGYLDVAFYGCTDNRTPQGLPGAVCLRNATWSEPPRCIRGPMAGQRPAAFPDQWMPSVVQNTQGADDQSPSLSGILDEISL